MRVTARTGRVLAAGAAATAAVSVALTSAPAGATPAGPAAAPAPKADYRFAGSLASSVAGAPALANVGTNSFLTTTVDGRSTKVLKFKQGNGLKLAPTTKVAGTTTYSVVILMEFDVVSDGWNRILDVQNLTNDYGLYSYYGALQYYSYGAGTTKPIAAKKWVQVALTRTAGNTLTGYVNGVQAFKPTADAAKASAIVASTMRFFLDNGSEESAGQVARIRVWNTALTAAQVKSLDRLP